MAGKSRKTPCFAPALPFEIGPEECLHEIEIIL
jgi:hypothetical protein